MGKNPGQHNNNKFSFASPSKPNFNLGKSSRREKISHVFVGGDEKEKLQKKIEI